MTNAEKLARKFLMDFLLSEIGVTELNSIVAVKDLSDAFQVELEDGSKKIITIIVTDSDE